MREFKNKRNPVLPLDIHIPDSEAHMMPDGSLYIYGSFDDRADVYCSEKYHVVSTPDMENWTIHDVSLSGRDIPWWNNPDAPKYPGIDWSKPTPFIQKMFADAAAKGSDIKESFEKEEKEKPALLFAPDCIHRDGKYYLYFCMSDDSEGAAVSDSPQGPFTDPVQFPCGGIDPAIFIDDDGQAYYYWGQLFSHGVRLNEDMVSFEIENVVDDLVTEEKHFFHEGSSMRKIGDTYYYVYADMERGKPTSLGYATSKSPLGPFDYQGIIIDNDGCDPQSWNNHGSIECVDGQWYVFYHRCSRGMQQYRRLCIEPLTIGEDGKIQEVKMTSQGIGEPYGPEDEIMGYQACGLKGTVYIGPYIQEDGEYSEKLMNISNGDEAVFRYVKSEHGFRNIKIYADECGDIEVLADGKSSGIIRITDGVQQNADIEIEEGTHEFTLKFAETEGLEIYKIVLK